MKEQRRARKQAVRDQALSLSDTPLYPGVVVRGNEPVDEQKIGLFRVWRPMWRPFHLQRLAVKQEPATVM